MRSGKREYYALVSICMVYIFPSLYFYSIYIFILKSGSPREIYLHLNAFIQSDNLF